MSSELEELYSFVDEMKEEVNELDALLAPLNAREQQIRAKLSQTYRMTVIADERDERKTRVAILGFTGQKAMVMTAVWLGREPDQSKPYKERASRGYGFCERNIRQINHGARAKRQSLFEELHNPCRLFRKAREKRKLIWGQIHATLRVINHIRKSEEQKKQRRIRQDNTEQLQFFKAS
jgi:hypothetical protein